MISALLSNTPVNVLRGNANAGDRRLDPDEQQAQRGTESVRQSEVNPQAVSTEKGNVPPLSKDAVVALQSVDDTQPAAAKNQPADGQAATSEDDQDGDGLSEAEEKQVDKLKQRDQEVRAHEQAHARVGGAYAGAPSYTFQQGPDGKRYAVGGEVQIDTAKERTPEATIRKMQIVIRAATAPAEPSSQDLKVAQQARAQLSEAQAEQRQMKAEELSGESSAPSSLSTPDKQDAGKAEGESFNLRNGKIKNADQSDETSPIRPDFLAAYEASSRRRDGTDQRERQSVYQLV